MANRGKGARGGYFMKTSTNHKNQVSKSVLERLGPRSNNKHLVYVKKQSNSSAIAALPGDLRVSALAKKFVKSYFEIFDQPGRANLESQYSADAFFSFSATYPVPTYGRNLLQVHEPESRVQLLFHNRTNIAAALTGFTPTEHLFNSLCTDVPYYTANPMSVTAMQIVVTGVLKDPSEQKNPLRAFTRVFALKQVSTRDNGEPVFEIFNDLFMLQAPGPDQIKRYHIEARNTPSNSQNRPAPSSSEKEKQDKLRSIMEKTKMNRLGSEKLLSDYNWDEARALEVFNVLQTSNRVPQEFFIT